MFDDHRRIARIDQLLKQIEQFCGVRGMEPGGRFVEDVYMAGLMQFLGEFDALIFAAGKRVGGLSDTFCLTIAGMSVFVMKRS